MNKDLSVSAPPERETLILTYNRTSTQKVVYNHITDKDLDRKVINVKRRSNYGKNFKMLKTPPRYCNSIVAVEIEKENNTTVSAVFHRIKCNTYSCPRCHDRVILTKKMMLREVIVKNKLNHLITLTLDPSSVPWEYLNDQWNNTHAYITKLFNDWTTNLRRKYKLKPKYLWIMEYQGNGNAHMHILTNKFMPINAIRKEWVRLGGGVSMSIEKVKNLKAVSNYVLKYLSKGFNNPNFYIGQKRYSISQSCIRSRFIKPKVINSYAEACMLLGVKESESIVSEMNKYNPSNIVFLKGGE